RPTVHVAGSKGKGSTGAMVEAIVAAAGKRAGYYISPHLHRYNERIRMDGKPCEQDAFAAAMTRVREAIDAVAPRFAGREFLAFDALTAAAFVAFRDAGVDVQVVEVGLGGMLDSTNVFDATEVVIITPISLEHTAVLGDTIPAIASQKAGIITPGATVVVAPQRESAIDVIRATADERGARVIEVAKACQLARTSASSDGQEFKMKTERATYAAKLPLAGRHQLDNAATAILACEELAARAGFDVTPQDVRKGLADLVWPGRLEVLKRRPLVIVDGAHNGDSAKRMAAALREHFGLAHATFLFGTLAGKDIASMAEAIAEMASDVFVTGWPGARAADPRQLAEAFRPYEAPVQTFTSLPDAYEAAAASAGERGAVVAFGSIAFVAAVREYLLGIESDMIMLTIQKGRSPRGPATG
ncbi:MAG TPA: folylpolyglutamate synthase/dihydrofolate synthase family protein, partial [Dehalococcoidia bacterium]|nr:folylpolyglutamate synthase/dihydrofolate synthase family protein [Dehalococcoidia bacterium]